MAPSRADRSLPAGYPTSWEADVVLRDGSVAHLRPVKPEDAGLLAQFYGEQSRQSLFLRFFSPVAQVPPGVIRSATNVDYVDHGVLMATVRDRPLGYARFARIEATVAEIAFTVADTHHGRGIASILLEHLAAIGLELGITRFVADVLAENHKMLGVLRTAGYQLEVGHNVGYSTLTFDIAPTATSTAIRLAREHRAESRSVRSVLYPTSLTVVGASRQPESIGHVFLRNVLESGFTGAVTAVNPRTDEVLGVPSYPRVVDVPGDLDLVVLSVPAEATLEVVEQCAAKGVRTLLIPAGRFAEAGEGGRRLQDALRTTALTSGMRVVGPVSFGIVCNDPAAPLNASLAPVMPPPGGLGLFVESGTLAIAVLESAAERNLGLSGFASAGNRVDVSSNDLMQYWIDDAATHAVGLYLESIGNPRKFSRIARQLSLVKPVIVVKSDAVQFAGLPGLGVQPPAKPEALEAMLHQSGVIRADGIGELFDIAEFVLHQPLPQGRRVGVVANSHALASLTADAILGAGLAVADASLAVDIDAGADEYAVALRATLEAPDVDSVITAFVPAIRTRGADVIRAIRDVAASHDKPCAAIFHGRHGLVDDLSLGRLPDGNRRVVPAYRMPEEAVRAVAAATEYSLWKQRDHGEHVSPEGIDAEAAAGLIADVLKTSPAGRRLHSAETRRLLAAYGIELWPHEIVTSEAAAVAAAERLGYPVVLQALETRGWHTRMITGLRVDLGTSVAVRSAFEELSRRTGAPPDDPVFVQRMSPPGMHCIVGTTEDPLLGPVLTFCETSLGGEPPRDLGYRVPPVTDVDIRELITSTRIGHVLSNPGGPEPPHMKELRDIVARLSVMADAHPDLALVLLDPVSCWNDGVSVLGGLVVVAPSPGRPDPARRALG